MKCIKSIIIVSFLILAVSPSLFAAKHLVGWREVKDMRNGKISGQKILVYSYFKINKLEIKGKHQKTEITETPKPISPRKEYDPYEYLIKIGPNDLKGKRIVFHLDDEVFFKINYTNAVFFENNKNSDVMLLKAAPDYDGENLGIKVSYPHIPNMNVQIAGVNLSEDAPVKERTLHLYNNDFLKRLDNMRSNGLDEEFSHLVREVTWYKKKAIEKGAEKFKEISAIPNCMRGWCNYEINMDTLHNAKLSGENIAISHITLRNVTEPHEMIEINKESIINMRKINDRKNTYFYVPNNKQNKSTASDELDKIVGIVYENEKTETDSDESSSEEDESSSDEDGNDDNNDDSSTPNNKRKIDEVDDSIIHVSKKIKLDSEVREVVNCDNRDNSETGTVEHQERQIDSNVAQPDKIYQYCDSLTLEENAHLFYNKIMSSVGLYGKESSYGSEKSNLILNIIEEDLKTLDRYEKFLNSKQLFNLHSHVFKIYRKLKATDKEIESGNRAVFYLEEYRNEHNDHPICLTDIAVMFKSLAYAVTDKINSINNDKEAIRRLRRDLVYYCESALSCYYANKEAIFNDRALVFIMSSKAYAMFNLKYDANEIIDAIDDLFDHFNDSQIIEFSSAKTLAGLYLKHAICFWEIKNDDLALQAIDKALSLGLKIEDTLYFNNAFKDFLFVNGRLKN